MIFGQSINLELDKIAKSLADLAFNNELDLDKVFIKLREKTYKEFQDLEDDKETKDNNNDGDELITYDLMYIVRPDIEKDYTIISYDIINYLKHSSDKYNDDLDININKDIDHWGKKNLAYMINRYTEGYYTLIRDLTCSKRVMKDLINNNLKYDKDILRYMVVRKGE